MFKITLIGALSFLYTGLSLAQNFHLYTEEKTLLGKECRTKEISSCNKSDVIVFGEMAKIKQRYINNVLEKESLPSLQELAERKERLTQEVEAMETRKKEFGKEAIDNFLYNKAKGDLERVTNLYERSMTLPKEAAHIADTIIKDISEKEFITSSENTNEFIKELLEGNLVVVFDRAKLLPLLQNEVSSYGGCEIKHDGNYFHIFKGDEKIAKTTIIHYFLEHRPQERHFADLSKALFKAGCGESRKD